MTDTEKLMRAALIDLYVAVNNGDVDLVHWPVGENDESGYSAECPMDDTCECPCRQVFNKLQAVAECLGITSRDISDGLE